MHIDVSVNSTTTLAAAIRAGDYPVITDNGRYDIPADVPRGHTIKVTGAAKPTLEASDTSSPRVEAHGTSSPRVVAYDTSSPTVEAHGTSSPTVVAYDTSSPTVEASDTSSPSVVAHGTSSPTVEAHGTSSPSVEAYDTSFPSVEAKDYSSTVARGPVTITADTTATVRAIGTQPTVTGGALVQRVPLTTNPTLVRGVLAHIEAHPEQWNQGSWALTTDCGTAFCYAGHAAVMVGAKVDIENATVEVASLPEHLRGRFAREHVAISAAARAALGLDEKTADRLFNGGNTLDELREMVAEICDVAPSGARPVGA